MSKTPARPGRLTWLRRSLQTFAIIYLLICVTMFIAQDWLVFMPTSQDADQASTLLAREDIEDLTVEVDGATLRGVMLRGTGEGPRPAVLYFGGNAESIWRRVSDRDWVAERGIHVVLVSYRGYDRSTGTPAAEDLLRDGVAVFDAIAARPDVDADQVFAWGFSMGTGVAAALAEERPLAGVILAAPYGRLSDVAADQYPWLPVRWLFRHEIDTLARAPKITEPVLVLHGDADTLIAPRHGEAVTKAWQGPAQLEIVPDAGHNDLVRTSRLQPLIEAFFDAHRGGPPTAQ